MTMQQPSDRLSQVLAAHREEMIDEHMRRLLAALPIFRTLDPPEMRRRSTRIVDWIIASLSGRDVSILAQHLEGGIRRRMQEGFTAATQITATQILEEVIADMARRTLADDPVVLAEALRRIHSQGVMGRNAVSRINLAETVKKPPA